MTNPRNYQTDAIVIKKTKLGEADTILTFYTPDRGKIQGFAKSLRKTKSKMAGHLELITHSRVTFARGRNLDTITGSQTIDSFVALKSDFKLMSYALYVIELVNQFTPEHYEDYKLFQLLLETLKNLCQTDDIETLLRFFEIHLLSEVGYRPQLQQCVNCRKVLEPVTNTFSPASGGVLCPECSYKSASILFSLSVNALKVLRFFQNNDYDTASRLKVPPELSTELEKVIRGYIRYLLERDLKSVAWLDSLRYESGL
ncbi:MAG: DNA repair protein RecO [Dehalococcoidales bacterium]|nr:DNA repair protein RecO [Dehalococcoidales bacterium]